MAFIGGNFLADLLAPKVADYLEPKFASAIESRLEEQMQAALPSSDGALPEASVDVPLADILDILKDMGLYQSAVDAIDKAVEQGMTDVAASTAAAVAASIAETVAYMILFVAGFVIVLVAWTVFSHALDLGSPASPASIFSTRPEGRSWASSRAAPFSSCVRG